MCGFFPIFNQLKLDVSRKGRFLANPDFRAHMKTHQDAAAATDNLATKQNFHCKECDKYFRIKCHYEDHLRWHTGERRYRCVCVWVCVCVCTSSI